MIISEEQVRRALEYLQTSKREGAPDTGPFVGPQIPTELIDRIRDAVSTAPDTREDRIAHARELLAGTGPTSVEVAEKMIGRIVSDSLR